MSGDPFDLVSQRKFSNTVHCCLSISGALKSKKWLKAFSHGDGRPCTSEEAKAYLREKQAEGYKVLPMGDECDNFDPQVGCRGHQEADYLKTTENA